MKTIAVLGAFFAVLLPCHALENGSFEAADRSYFVFPGVQLPPDRCLPGWNTGNDSGLLYYSGVDFYLPGVFRLYDDEARRADTTGLVNTLPIAGDIAIGVIPNADTSGGVLSKPPYIEQSSFVPVGAKSLWFLWQGERLNLRISGNLVPFSLAEQRLTDDPFVPVHNYYAADISQYAGQEVTVRFEFFAKELHPFPPWPGAVQALDDVYFSTIPEPNTLSLFALGVGWLLVGQRKRRVAEHSTR